MTLTGLTAELYPAQPVPVTLTFSSGASVTVIMAVQLPSEVPTAPTVSEATEAGGRVTSTPRTPRSARHFCRRPPVTSAG